MRGEEEIIRGEEEIIRGEKWWNKPMFFFPLQALCGRSMKKLLPRFLQTLRFLNTMKSTDL